MGACHLCRSIIRPIGLLDYQTYVREQYLKKDFLFLQLGDLPYFRAFLRGVESSPFGSSADRNCLSPQAGTP
jgi:hypothetical protein